MTTINYREIHFKTADLRDAKDMQTTKLKIEGMTCPNCAVHVEKALEAVPGVQSASVVLGQGATVTHSGVDLPTLQRAVAAAGDYRAYPE
jgi:Cu+-exporting ATPase